MWTYEKRLQYPVNIKNTNPRLAKIIIAQYGGPDGELAASLRYLSQRYSMPYPELIAILTDIGISVAEMLPPQNSMTDKPFSGILIHTVRSNEVLARYSKKNQFDKDTAPKKKESRHEITIRIFV